jgi:ubiquinone/menaquinone biosynthesis C-methylase UbiE
MPADEKPDSDPYLVAFHAAFAPELEDAIRRYRFAPNARVLDCPCGDGFYTAMLARHMRSGTLIAADISPLCLDQAREAVRSGSRELAVAFERADAYSLPFDDGSFDFVWCAQSMITLDDPVRALREMARVLQPGGRVAVLETDEYHHILLPWPIGLELAIQQAVREESKRRYGSGAKFAQSRRLRGEFRDAGLTPSRKVTVAADREAPFGSKEREFLARHFEYLRDFVGKELTNRERAEFDRVTGPDSEESLLLRDDAELTCLVTICHAAKE